MAATLALVMVSCSGADTPRRETPQSDAPLSEATAPAGFPAGAVARTAPPDNELTEARAELGRRLFYDTNLSRTREVACASCHRQENGFADPRSVSTGVDDQRGTRNAPGLANLAFSQHFFWDGRAASLEEQAGKPIENPLEMDLSLDVAVGRLREDSSYVEQFEDAYGETTSENLRRALASFVRTLVSGNSAYDRHLAGDDRDFSPAAARGEKLFFSERTSCFHCHPEGALTNDGFFNDGSYLDGGDEGRKAITGRSGDLGKFKVPGLRNVAVTGPYMHDGSLQTLQEVIQQYAAGGRGHSNTDPQIVPLTLSADETDDLLAFLDALTDPVFLSDERFRTSR